MPVNDMHGYGLFETTPDQRDPEILYSYTGDILKKGGFVQMGQGYVEAGTVMSLDEASGKWIKYNDGNDVNDVQTLTLSGTPTAGTFQVRFTPPSFNTPPTGSGPFDSTVIDGTGGVSAAEIQTALRAADPSLSQVTVSGTGPYTITFAGAYAAQDVPLLQVVNNTLNASGTPLTGSVAQTTVGVSAGGVAAGILDRAVDTTLRHEAANIYFRGTFKTNMLIGMDANALSDLRGKQNTAYGWTRIDG